MSLIKDELFAIVNNYNMIDRSWNSFWETYDCYLEEEPEEAGTVGLSDRKSVNAVLHSISYQSNSEYGYDLICISIRMYAGNSIVGYYDLLFYENGDVFDDFFVIE